MASLITPETGRLVTLIFPIVDKSGGPPYAMSIKLVTVRFLRGSYPGEKLAAERAERRKNRAGETE
eukprot:711506-Amorphochlora_amoeboformis.AAC.1